MRRLIENVQGMAKQGQAAHEVEPALWQSVLALGREVMPAFFDALGDGDEGPVAVLNGGRTVRRLEEPHRREYRSVFGALVLEKAVYGAREEPKIEAVPLDARLLWHEDKWSY